MSKIGLNRSFGKGDLQCAGSWPNPQVDDAVWPAIDYYHVVVYQIVLAILDYFRDLDYLVKRWKKKKERKGEKEEEEEEEEEEKTIVNFRQ